MDAQSIAESAITFRDTLAIDCVRAPRQLSAASLVDDSSIRAIGTMLPAAPIIIWDADMYELAIGGFDSFVGLQNSNVWHPDSPEFWYYNQFSIDIRALGGALGQSVEDSHECRGGLFIPASHTRDGVAVFVLVMLPEVRGRFYFRFMRMDVVTASVAQTLAAYAFTQQKLAARERVALPRAARRRIDKAGKPQPEIRIIQLRQRAPSGSASGEREYHHKWIVKGHWRRLHEPRKNDGAEVTFVHAYVKGPQDAPLIQPRESVYVVAR